MAGWTMHRQQQQKGAQFQSQGTTAPSKQAEAPPPEAVQGRDAQDHDSAAGDVAPAAEPQPGDYPASDMTHADGDNTPTKHGDAGRSWDAVVQPEQHPGPARQMDNEGAECVRLRREQAALQEAAAHRNSVSGER